MTSTETSNIEMALGPIELDTGASIEGQEQHDFLTPSFGYLTHHHECRGVQDRAFDH